MSRGVASPLTSPSLRSLSPRRQRGGAVPEDDVRLVSAVSTAYGTNVLTEDVLQCKTDLQIGKQNCASKEFTLIGLGLKKNPPHFQMMCTL